MQDPHPVPPFTKPVKGSVTVPGSKSITNRALIIAALADGETLLENCLFSEDTEIMVKALQDLGFDVRPTPADKTIRITGLGGDIPNKKADLFVGNSGTSARFLTAFLCLGEGGDYTLDGVPQMRKRPIADLAETLNQLGANIETTDGFAPLRIRTNGLEGGKATIDATASSQFVSALVMAAPYAKQGIQIEMANTSVRRGYIDMTLEMLKQFGVPKSSLSASDSGYNIQNYTPYQSKPDGYLVEGDASAASYFFALPVVVTGQLEIHGVTKESLQGDIEFSTRAEEAGAYIVWDERSATVHYEPGAQPESLEGSFYPYSDTFLTAAAIAPILHGTTRIEGIAHTRHQECDRIAAMADGLQRLGQSVEETEGSLTITPQPLKPASVATYHDHRVAMSFGILGCYDAFGNGQPWLQVEDPTCCKKTFPDFFEVLEKLRQDSLRSAVL
ncbi:3-phosphoshikimate 1-carboxyvinyltransferase [Pelagicoccus mobilis]|uniref:3-phosphoshikimate 1-carboxyvinyltransferase n=1 Tax=Pelagicoccus mobilis TaxID=415221 RepID=A0A934VS23_9BACT|nr:3-phosphoshikimate 1-carboxyvinyltransferase [Pelagicoccus mobilis]MBK1879997.1 3-phosphoshikimate 1-carboxyvinyltransferase [Pelagicoccus mobilis]